MVKKNNNIAIIIAIIVIVVLAAVVIYYYLGNRDVRLSAPAQVGCVCYCVTPTGWFGGYYRKPVSFLPTDGHKCEDYNGGKCVGRFDEIGRLEECGAGVGA